MSTSTSPPAPPPTSTSPTQPQPRIRLARPSDAPQVSALIATTWTENFGWSVPPSDLARHLAGALSVERIREEIGRPDMRFLVSLPAGPDSRAPEPGAGPGTSPHALAEEDQITGVVHLIYGPAEPCLTLPSPAELNRCYVLKSQQGTGLAAALMARGEEQARSEGYKSLWLGVWEKNPRAERFYAKMGFKRVGEHYFYVGSNERRDWVMEKAI